MVERTHWGNGIGIKGKKILFGVSGGIAIYKAADYCRGLNKLGAKVYPVLTKNAQRFCSPLMFSALADQCALGDVQAFDPEHPYVHIELPRKVDCFLVCPATCNMLAKAANGLADDLLTTMITAYAGKVIFFPAMNPSMYTNPITQKNIALLEGTGHIVVEPGKGEVACGEKGRGRLVDFETFIHTIQFHLMPKPLLGKKVLITCGPTREPIDPVRFISNRSSGKMGYELAWAATTLGAECHVISGPTWHSPPPMVKEWIRIETAMEMFEAVKGLYRDMDIIIMAAAVADYTPKTIKTEKIKKDHDTLHIHLDKTHDILEFLSRNRLNGQCLVGFSAETSDLLERARKKMAQKPVDILVANDVTEQGAGFNVATNKVIIISNNGKSVDELPLMHKAEVALEILSRAEKVLN